MTPVVKEITARNMGEKQAVVTYKLVEVIVLGEKFSTEDDINNDGVGDYTSEDLLEILEEYPFHITINISNGGVMEVGTGSADITISFIWPYEEGGTPEEIEEKDELDTYWGKEASDYYKEQLELNPDNEEDIIPSVTLKIELKATQV